jgi:hypothetical protein
MKLFHHYLFTYFNATMDLIMLVLPMILKEEYGSTTQDITKMFYL